MLWCTFLGWGVDPGGVGLGGVDLLGDGDLSAFLLTLLLPRLDATLAVSPQGEL